jgi:tetratricopeptide (TPR) repeat protein
MPAFLRVSCHRLIAGLCLIVSLLASQVAQAQPIGQIDQLLGNLEKSNISTLQAIDLWRLEDKYDLFDGHSRQRLMTILKTISDTKKTPLPLKRLAIRMLAKAQASASLDKQARATRQRLGYIEDWWLIGPFDNEGNRGYKSVFAPERIVDLDQQPQGKQTKVTWRRYPAGTNDGQVRLHPLYKPSNRVAAYGLTVLETSRETPINLHAGCDDGCKIWINEQLVLDDPGFHRYAPDQHSLMLTLPRGKNRVLVKVIQNEGAWGFSLALTDRLGRPITAIKSVSDAGRLRQILNENMPPAPGKITAGQTLADWFNKKSELHPNNPRILTENALALIRTRVGDNRQRRSDQLVHRAIELLNACQKDCDDTRLMLAKACDDPDQSDRLLRQIPATSKNYVAALFHLGLANHIRNRVDQAIKAHRRVLAVQPGYLPSELELVELLQNFQLDSLAELKIKRLVKAYPDVPEVMMVAANFYRKSGLFKRSRELYIRLITLKADDHLGLRALFELATKRGDLTAALTWLNRLIKLAPLRIGWWIEQGDLLLHNGQHSRALDAYRRAQAICPRNPVGLVREGLAFVALGRREEALRRWTQALALSPQDRALQRHIESLHIKKEAFYKPWAKDLLKLPAQEINTHQDADAVRLVDLTVVRLFPNGMTSRYRQQLLKIKTAHGAERMRTFQILYSPGRQQLRVLQSRVIHADGRGDTSVLINDYILSEPWYNLYYDVNSREITFPSLSAGDLVELTYQLDDIGSQTLFDGYFGDLAPFEFDVPARQVTYVLLAPAKKKIAFNIPTRASHRQSTTGDHIVHVWEARNLKAIEPEPNMPGFTETHSFLHISTHESWSKLSNWYLDLSADQLVAGPKIKKLARDLTAEIKQPVEKIRAIYRFVSDRTRYVGLEFGIHSYIPYQASQVLSRKFGDCKDKAALLVSLLREAGLRANLALVRTSRFGKVDPFPPSLALFNHAICYLPDFDMWLDATAPFHDINDLPPQDQDIIALVIDSNSKSPTTTKTSTASQNQTRIKFAIEHNPDNSADIHSQVEVSGSMAPSMRAQFIGSSAPKDVFERTMNELFPGSRVDSLDLENLMRPDLPFVTKAKFKVPFMAQRKQKTVDIPALGRNTVYQKIFSPYQKRSHDLVLAPAWTIHWSVTHNLPEGYKLTSLPENGELKTAFGGAKLEFSAKDNEVEVRAEFQIVKNRIAASDYSAFREFLGKVDRFFDRRLVLTGDRHAGS